MPTSSVGRCQFWAEKAYRVSARKPDLAGRAHHLAHRLGPLAVALDPGQSLPLRPAAVAVHDDRNVARQDRGQARGINGHAASSGITAALLWATGPVHPALGATARMTPDPIPGGSVEDAEAVRVSPR